MTGRDVALLARTAVHLRPGQIAQRARLPTARAQTRSSSVKLSGSGPATS